MSDADDAGFEWMVILFSKYGLNLKFLIENLGVVLYTSIYSICLVNVLSDWPLYLHLYLLVVAN
jgi:hypothetical protein